MEGTFLGGIHPFEGKDLSKDLPIKQVLPKGNLVYPVSQHIGAPAKPVVSKGDRVLVGQKIAEAGGFISADICCSVSGTVKAVEPHLTVSGNMVSSIIVENDGKYETVEGFGKERDYQTMTKEEIRACIKDAGVVGMGGAGFPTHVKLTPKDDDAIDYVLVNGAECEPYLTSDYRVMLESPEEVVGGLKVILKLFDKARGYICIEDNKPEAIAAMQKACEGQERIEVKVLKTKYPQGAERTLIYAATGRKIYSAKLPSDAGCVVDNIDTVVAVYKAVCKSTPLIRRIVTVTGDAIAEPVNMEVKTGTVYSELIAEAGGYKKDSKGNETQPEKVVSGGPMMGMALHSLDVPVMKTSSALLCMTKDEVAQHEPSPCIRCGRCVSACPSRLVPQKMAVAAEHGDYEAFEAYGGMECYECGSCTFVCPAKKQLTQTFKEARRHVMDARRKKPDAPKKS